MPGLFDAKAKAVTTGLKESGFMLVTAESCTGGMIAVAITDLAGSSSVFDRGFVTYTNDSKHELLGVSREILENYGAVSRECASAMVQGAIAHSTADIAVSVTGIAGPGGGTPDKPVGVVYIGWGLRGVTPHVEKHLFSGDRSDIRRQTVDAALDHIMSELKNERSSKTRGDHE